MENDNLKSIQSTIKQLLDQQAQNNINIQQQLLHQLYQQFEAYIMICEMLDLRHPLPPMRVWAASPDFLSLLLGIIMENKPDLVVELGSGVSTLVIAYALQKQGSGKLLSVEHEPEYLEKTTRQVNLHGLDDYVRVIHAPLTPCQVNGKQWKWYNMESIGIEENIDILVIDGPPSTVQPRSRYPAVPLLLDYFSEDVVVLLDNAARPDERAIVDEWLATYPDFNHEFLSCEKGATVLRRSSR